MAGPEVTAALKLRDDMSPALREAAGHVSGFSSFVQQAGATMVGFLGAQVVNNISNFIAGSVAARTESDKLVAQTNAAIKSTGGVAKVTAEHIDALAQAIANYSGVDDEAVANGENLLLTFTNIRNEAGKGNDIFDQTTKIMVDMSKALGTDAAGSAIQLGKALNDPLKGITALTRVGVTFSDEQKKQIANFMKHGDLMGAQKVILRELAKEFGGSAKAYGDSSAGMMDKMKVAVGNAQEALGGLILILVGQVAPAITASVLAVQGWLEGNAQLVTQVGELAQDVLPKLVEGIKGGLGWLADHGDLVKAVLAGIAGAALAWGISTLTTVVPALIAQAIATWAAMAPLLPLYALILGIGVLVALVAYAWVHNFGDIQGKTKAVWAVVGPILQMLWSWLSENIPPALEFLGTVFGEVFSAIGTTVYNTIVSVAKSIGIVRTAISTITQIGRDLVEGLKQGIIDKWNAFVSWLSGLVKLLPQPLKDALGIHSPSSVMEEVGKNYVLGLQQGISKSWPGVTRIASSLSVPGGFATGGVGGGEVHNHYHVDQGAWIDGPSLDILANRIAQRQQYAPGS